MPPLKNRALVGIVAASIAFVTQASDITGAGASFIYPVMSKWSAEYASATGNKVNYQSIGSGGGIAQIKFFVYHAMNCFHIFVCYIFYCLYEK